MMEHPEPPPECKTEAEKTAFAFGWFKAMEAQRMAKPEQKPAQVSPLEFVTMTLEKEHLVGRPIIWAQWPNEEKAK